MTWLATIAPVIKAQVEQNVLASAVNPAFEAEWQDDRQPYVHPEAQVEVLLQVTTVRNIAQEAAQEAISLSLPGLTLTFTAAGATVTRAAGSWITDGVKPGCSLSIAGTVSNNFTGAYIATVTASTLTLEDQALVNEGPIAAMATIDGLERTIGGHRIITLNVKAQSDSHVPQYWAQEFLERLSQRLEKQSVSDALSAVNCGIIDLSDITYIPNVKVDKRLLSVAVLDVFISAAFDDTDGAEIVGYFNRIDLTGAIVSQSGVVYPNGVNPSHVVIPPGI